MENKNELNVEFKWIEGYEGLYFIDTLGNVVSVPRIEGRFIHNKYNILKTRINRLGYVQLSLMKNGKMKTHLLHRIIAKAFVSNPNNYNVINHKNGIKSDNRIENLEWVTKAQNTKHAFDNNLGNLKISSLNALEKYNALNAYNKIILSKDGKEYEFKSTTEAGKFLNTTNNEITRAIRKQQRCKGYYVFGEKPKANGEA